MHFINLTWELKGQCPKILSFNFSPVILKKLKYVAGTQPGPSSREARASNSARASAFQCEASRV